MPYRSYSELFVLAVLAAWASGMSNSEARRSFEASLELADELEAA